MNKVPTENRETGFSRNNIKTANKKDLEQKGVLFEAEDSEKLLIRAEESTKKLNEEYQNLLTKNLALKFYTVDCKVEPVEVSVYEENEEFYVIDKSKNKEKNLLDRILAEDEEFIRFLNTLK